MEWCKVSLPKPTTYINLTLNITWKPPRLSATTSWVQERSGDMCVLQRGGLGWQVWVTEAVLQPEEKSRSTVGSVAALWEKAQQHQGHVDPHEDAPQEWPGRRRQPCRQLRDDMPC